MNHSQTPWAVTLEIPVALGESVIVMINDRTGIKVALTETLTSKLV